MKKIIQPLLYTALGGLVVLAIIGGKSLVSNRLPKSDVKGLRSEVVTSTPTLTIIPTTTPTNTPTPKPKMIYKPTSTPLPTNTPIPTQVPQVQAPAVSVEVTCKAYQEEQKNTYYAMYGHDMSDPYGQYVLSDLYVYCLSHNGSLSGWNVPPPPKQ